MICGGDHNCRVDLPLADVVDGREFQQVLDILFGHLAGAILRRPILSSREELVTQHVHHTDLRDSGSKQIWSLVDDSADEESAVGAALQREAPRAG